MGAIDLIRPKKERKQIEATAAALQAAQTSNEADGRFGKFVLLLLSFGLDGKGPLHSAQEVAEDALSKSKTREAAIGRVARRAVAGGAAGGFATGVGGFVTMPVAMPANVFEFYVQAVRMVGAIAHLRGYNIREPEVRTAILLTLIGSNSQDVLVKAGIPTGGGQLTTMAKHGLPPSVLILLNKAVGFRIARGVAERMFTRLGRGIPFAGGVFAGGLDGVMMKKIADQAMKEFPARTW